jgi:hypothetical protein
MMAFKNKYLKVFGSTGRKRGDKGIFGVLFMISA